MWRGGEEEAVKGRRQKTDSIKNVHKLMFEHTRSVPSGTQAHGGVVLLALDCLGNLRNKHKWKLKEQK